MRINQFLAQATGLSRRYVDLAIKDGRVMVNNELARIGQLIELSDKITLDNKLVSTPKQKTVLLINKPSGYVCSRDGQGSPTIYDLIPTKYHNLKHVGRLDKESSGLILLTDDGELAHKLSHPSFDKLKIYIVVLNKTLTPKDQSSLEKGKIILDGKPSVLKIKFYGEDLNTYEVELREGRNRQIRRTFSQLGYEIKDLNRIQFGEYSLSQLNKQRFIKVKD
jgi:23S rRNA pseudouridine2605 synthase